MFPALCGYLCTACFTGSKPEVAGLFQRTGQSPCADEHKAPVSCSSVQLLCTVSTETAACLHVGCSHGGQSRPRPTDPLLNPTSAGEEAARGNWLLGSEAVAVAWLPGSSVTPRGHAGQQSLLGSPTWLWTGCAACWLWPRTSSSCPL